MENELSYLVNLLKAQKETLDEAKRAHAETELKIAALLPSPLGGSKTHEVDGLKVTVSTPVNHAVDYAAALDAGIPANQMPVRHKITYNKTEGEKMRLEAPEKFNYFSRFVTAKEGKPSVKIKPIDTDKD